MKINKDITKVICSIEYKIGNQTYNPNSYNGWTCEEGCEFRYPVTYCVDKTAVEEQRSEKTNGIICDISPDCIDTIKYKFGSNHLYVGNGIVKVLEYLEDRYNLDFNKLEEEYKNRILEKMREMEQELNNGKVVKILRGNWIAGFNIPTGTYNFYYDDKLDRTTIFIIRDENKRDVLFSRDKKIYSVTLKENYTLSIYNDCLMEKPEE